MKMKIFALTILLFFLIKELNCSDCDIGTVCSVKIHLNIIINF